MTVAYNLGEGLDAATSVFKAPKEGIYKFTVRTFAFGERTILGLALHTPSLITKNVLWVQARSPGVLSTLIALKAGEEVVPFFDVEKYLVASTKEDRGSLYNEFSGELVAELCGGKAC